MNINDLPARYKVETIDRLRINPTGLPFRYGEELPPIVQQMKAEGYFTEHSAEAGIVRLLPTQKLLDEVAEWDEAALRCQIVAERPQGLIGGCNFGYA